jgi:Mrp family chromosome partitioning ATPase
VNPVRLLRSGAMDQFIEQISKGADFIVMDCPAGSAFGDAMVLAANVQNVVLIHEAGKAASGAEYEFHKTLERLGVNVIGMVLNKTRTEDCPAYRHYLRNYQSTIARYHGKPRAALGPGTTAAKKLEEKPQQYGTRTEDEEE